MKNISKADKQFYDEIKNALNEKDVENIYRRLFKIALPQSEIKSYCKTDGVLISDYPKNYKDNVKEHVHKLVALLEFKHKYDFQKSYDDLIKALIQSLYYLKNCKQIIDDYSIPKVIFAGCENSCFCLGTDVLEKYLNDSTINWDLAPSTAYVDNRELFDRLKDDEDIIPLRYKVDRNFKFSDIVIKMFEFDEGNVIKMCIDVDHIDSVFKKFTKDVLKEKKLSTHQEVSIFMNMLLDTKNNENFLREDKSLYHTSVSGLENVKIDVKHFKSFFIKYHNKYTVSEKRKLTQACDRLIEDENRRREGAFFTPTAWVNEAHKMIEDELGEDWRDEYVVWDCCAGTGNLTRDYEFKELYCSTLIQEELDILKGNKINEKATKFQHDFLRLDENSLMELKGTPSLSKFMGTEEKFDLPIKLLNAFKENKKIIFLMNPPYGRAGNMRTKTGIHKKGIAKSSIGELMKKDGMGTCSAQLYAQFLYEIMVYKKKYKLDNVIIGTYSTPLFLTGSSFKKFRNKFLNEFEYKNGMLFQASHFSDVSKEWGILFSIWKSGVTEDKNEFNLELKDIINDNVEKVGNKIVYNLDNGIKAGEWVREEIKGMKTHKDCVQMRSALNPNLDGKLYGSDIKGSIGYFNNHGNNVVENAQSVGLYSKIYSSGAGIPVLPKNYKKCVALFTARKSVKNDWINHVDEYSEPTVVNDYENWNNDCIVYSLFNSKSQQSAMREIEFKDKVWDIKNEWFWMSKNAMLKLGEKYKFDGVQYDLEHDNERFVYEELKNIKLSDDAQKVLDKATELVKKSFEYRERMHEQYPEYNLQCWDSGWYQIKKILNIYMKDELKEFNIMYKEFENRMREGVFKFGFLREE